MAIVYKILNVSYPRDRIIIVKWSATGYDERGNEVTIDQITSFPVGPEPSVLHLTDDVLIERIKKIPIPIFAEPPNV